VSSVQVPFGLLDPEAGDDVIPAAHRSGRLVIARGVLGAGLLGQRVAADASNADKVALIDALHALAADAGITMSALALGFVRARPDVDVILVGTSSAAHLRDAVATMLAGELDAAILDRIADVLSAQRQEPRVS
jgi:L-glyceraldehyde 3-phosphate reductase